MASCFSFTSSRDRCFRYSFTHAGLKSSTTDLGDGTIIHCWIPKKQSDHKPNLLLIHGLGANAMWQWNHFIPPLSSSFNVYVPDLVFFGESYTTRADRSDAFQAQCLVKAMEAHGVCKINVVGLSYGGFVAYSLAAQFPRVVERVVIGAAGVCFMEKDVEEGLFEVGCLEEAVELLLPQTPQKLRELIKLSFYKPAKNVPSCFLDDFINVMCTEHLQERKELIIALHKDRKLDDIPKITQPTLIIWGDKDRIFPPELAQRLKRHLGENAQLVLMKNAGHAINLEKPKVMLKALKSFLIDPLPPKLQSDSGFKED